MNSRSKGKRGELQAAAYLRSLGFASARRGAQHRGGTDSPDVLADELPGVHIEVKHRAGIDLGTAELDNAMTQANSDAGPDREPVVLWRRNRIGWRLTWIERGVQLTTTGDTEIAATLARLNAGAVGYLYDPHVADAIQRQRRIDSEACSIPITQRQCGPLPEAKP